MKIIIALSIATLIALAASQNVQAQDNRNTVVVGKHHLDAVKGDRMLCEGGGGKFEITDISAVIGSGDRVHWTCTYPDGSKISGTTTAKQHSSVRYHTTPFGNAQKRGISTSP